MSKVKYSLDNNSAKSRHRNRINETKDTKAKRIRKLEDHTYARLICGYSHVTEKETYRYEKVPGQKKKLVETKTRSVSILRRKPIGKKELKQWAARKQRRYKIVCDEDSALPQGSDYKKDFDIEWMIT